MHRIVAHGPAVPELGFEESRPPAGRPLTRPRPGGLEAEEPERLLRCLLCGHGIAGPRDRIQVRGAHEHAFTNPAGIPFRIGCFSRAPGCLQAGAFTEEYTWFPGFAWRYALCASCQAHLGWAYRDREGEEFYGLILDRLVEEG